MGTLQISYSSNTKNSFNIEVYTDKEGIPDMFEYINYLIEHCDNIQKESNAVTEVSNYLDNNDKIYDPVFAPPVEIDADKRILCLQNITTGVMYSFEHLSPREYIDFYVTELLTGEPVHLTRKNIDKQIGTKMTFTEKDFGPFGSIDKYGWTQFMLHDVSENKNFMYRIFDSSYLLFNNSQEES